MCMNWQIAIDGPAGAGKSTIAKEVAQKLGFVYIDTGAMYRAVTLKALALNINMDDEAEYHFLETTAIAFKNNHIFLDGVDVSDEIRSIEVTNNVSLVSKYGYVRQKLVALQREYANNQNIIMDGRDIGTVVLPNANLKIFLIATVEERAIRRMKEREQTGKQQLGLEATKVEIQERDFKDSNRKISPLAKATDAIEVDTSSLSVSEVVDQIISLVMERGYRMENVKTEKLNVETQVDNTTETGLEETNLEANATVEEDVVEEEIVEESEASVDAEEEVVEAESQTPANTLREMQLVEGTVVKVLRAIPAQMRDNNVIRKAKQERVLIKLENGEEGFLFKADVANLNEDDDLEDLFLEDDKVKVVVKRVYPDGGKVLLSTKLVAKREELKQFETVIANHASFVAKVVKSIKVGLILEYNDFACLLPSSQTESSVTNPQDLIGQEILVAPIRVDYNRIRLIVSQTVANAIKNKSEKQEFIKSIEIGQIFEGTVKNIESYGAFVELANGVEGLLHISEIEHNRIVKVEKVINVGDVVKVQVIKIDKDHIGLSRKVLLPNYWKEFIDTHAVNDIVQGKVNEINRSGVVVNINENIQAFLPKSEFSWEKDTFIEDFTKVGNDIEAKIIELDLNKKRIILSRKQLEENPWTTLKFKSGDSVKASVVKVMNEGVKVLVKGASGFLPKGGYASVANFVVGEEIDVKIKAFDPSKTRLIVSQKEDETLDKSAVSKLMKSQERGSSTLGELLNLSDYEDKK